MFVTIDFAAHTEEAEMVQSPAVWASIHVPIVEPEGWFVRVVQEGLRELERIRRETDAAMANLIASMPESRDLVANLARTFGVSNREARHRRNVAKVCDSLPEAAKMLGSGTTSAEHVALLEPVLDKSGVADLLAFAQVQSPEDFRGTVEQFRLSSEHGDDVDKRQRAQRKLRFFNGPDGMVGLNGLLPPVEGMLLKKTLADLVDRKWRAEHPERAESLGGHGGDQLDQRMADALLDLASVQTFGIANCITDNDPKKGDEHGDNSKNESSPQTPNLKVTPMRNKKPEVIIVFDVEKWQANLLGHGPIPVTASLFDQARAELFYLFKNTNGAIMKFIRARKDPTYLQRLAVIGRDHHCVYEGCHAPFDRCEIHHFDEWLKDIGFTDVEVLGLICKPHHRHIHLNNLIANRELDGTVTIQDRTTNTIIAHATKKQVAA